MTLSAFANLGDLVLGPVVQRDARAEIAAREHRAVD